jgi:hypothetical protein
MFLTKVIFRQNYIKQRIYREMFYYDKPFVKDHSALYAYFVYLNKDPITGSKYNLRYKLYRNVDVRQSKARNINAM